MTLDAFWMDHYLPHAKVHKRSWWRDEQLYRRIKPKFGHLPLSAIKRLAVEQFQTSLLVEEKLAPATVNQHVVLLRRMLNLAVQWEMLDRNVLTRFPHHGFHRKQFAADTQRQQQGSVKLVGGKAA